jgi:hypothetical protein
MVLAKLNYFYRQLCAKKIAVEMMEKLEKEIPMLLCKMEKNFPLGFFNPMQHLLIHLPYETKVGGHVQYRWIYHIERSLMRLHYPSEVPRSGGANSVTTCWIDYGLSPDVTYGTAHGALWSDFWVSFLVTLFQCLIPNV